MPDDIIVLHRKDPGCGEVVMGLIVLGFLAICALCGGGTWVLNKTSQQIQQPQVVNGQQGGDVGVNGQGIPGAGAQATNGILLLKARDPVKPGVQAWVEIDGKRVATWPVGTTELRLPLAAAQYRVAVYSIYENVRRTIYEGLVTVVADTTITIPVG